MNCRIPELSVFAADESNCELSSDTNIDWLWRLFYLTLRVYCSKTHWCSMANMNDQCFSETSEIHRSFRFKLLTNIEFNRFWSAQIINKVLEPVKLAVEVLIRTDTIWRKNWGLHKSNSDCKTSRNGWMKHRIRIWSIYWSRLKNLILYCNNS